VALFSSSHICIGSCHPVYSPNASKSWSVALIMFLTNCFKISCTFLSMPFVGLEACKEVLGCFFGCFA